MTASRDPERLIRAFFAEGLEELPDPVYDALRDRIETTRQRAVIGSWRTPDMNRYLKYGLAAAAVVIIAVIALNVLPGTPAPGSGPTPSPVPTAAEPAATPEVAKLLVGTWLAPPVTCAQQTAAVAAAFTAEQMALAWSCTEVDPVQYSIVFDPRRPEDGTYHLRQYADGVTGWSGAYHIVDDSTFQAGDLENYYITYRFAIDGDQLTIDMISDDFARADYGSATPSEAEVLGEHMAQTAIYETSPFTRQR
jgi:hypothetical protein